MERYGTLKFKFLSTFGRLSKTDLTVQKELRLQNVSNSKYLPRARRYELAQEIMETHLDEIKALYYMPRLDGPKLWINIVDKLGEDAAASCIESGLTDMRLGDREGTIDYFKKEAIRHGWNQK